MIYHFLQDIWQERPILLSGIIILVLFVLRQRSQLYRSSQAPTVPYVIPWLGSAISMGKNPDAFFADSTARFGPMFSVLAAGKKMTYITSSNLISAVYRDSKTFEFTPIRKEMSKTVFEMTHEAVYSAFMQQEYFPMHHRLLSQTAIPTLLSRYAELAEKSIIESLATRTAKGRALLSEFILSASYDAAAHAFFGTKFPVKETYPAFRVFDNKFHLIAGEMPYFLIKDARKAWEDVVDVIDKYIAQGPYEDAYELIDWLPTHAEEAGWNRKDVAASLGTELWALEANAIMVAFWVIALSLQQHPAGLGLAPLVAEIDKVRPANPENNDWIISASMPLLVSTIKETLRMTTSTFSIRRVTKDTVFAGYELKEDTRVICVTRAVHLDEEIHEDAHRFIPDRYLKIDAGKRLFKDGKEIKDHSMPFGGGVSICEGRHFALTELKIFLTLLLTHTKIEIDSEKGPQPAVELCTDRMGVGAMPPRGDLNVVIRPRIV
ncbi:cytochrome P450 [Armillaria luteobubalina]|uniref:Cytochrome P450 n=1 Tax=Armillaria luteobubalina TaxID=153913 RepID=A0AA39UHS9_9AGAR|nr:cytochrome P450 [Armillaria luteobubalina]